ncbi:hypothetical protein FSP39_013754 [Pinctada imbricata]|uniref:Uncharacterized protein n=1 Tax=Pinctada imbricata TaxID=66713 RepID=A0AA88YVD7_PINIB|nr:hypothetical protein FSP39_013754 [Pinctada imbricata]
MEEDKRKQKLKAGKEKLAAFQKKKAKKKKHSDDVDGTDVKSSGDTDVSSSSDVPYSDSDEIAVSGDEFPKDDGRMLLKMRKSLLTATERITELEELLQGKQLALDTVVKENAKLKSSSQLVSNQNFEEAIKKRDEIIQQLSAHIKATDGASQASYAVATETMVQEVQQLQKQLLEAGNMLRAQGEKHAESSKILQETRTEVLILQQSLADKEAVQTKMEDELRQLTQERDHWKSINEEHRAKEGLINQRLDNGTEFVEKENVVKLENATSLEIEIEHLRKELNESKKREQETGEVVKKLNAACRGGTKTRREINSSRYDLSV